MWADVGARIDGDLLKNGPKYKDGVRPLAHEEVEIRNGNVFLKVLEQEEAKP